jgi:glycosyltransferase involved in cell wall biosynthesis
VVIPAYNAAWCLEHALDSVLEQDHRPLEIIVVDDGSSDDTPALLERRDHELLRVIRQENRGLSAARNTGIEAAQGNYVAFLDADDWWLPGKLRAQVELMERRPEIGFCSVATRVEDPEGRLLQIWKCPEWEGDFLQAIFTELAAVAGSGSGVMARRELFQKARLFDESLRSLEDIDMWMRLAAVSGYACIDEPLAVILKRPDSMSRNLEVMREAAIQLLHKSRALLPLELQGGCWRNSLAGVYADYAKGDYRAGHRAAAVKDTLHALLLAPRRRGSLCLGLLKDMALGNRL